MFWLPVAKALLSTWRELSFSPSPGSLPRGAPLSSLPKIFFFLVCPALAFSSPSYSLLSLSFPGCLREPGQSGTLLSWKNNLQLKMEIIISQFLLSSSSGTTSWPGWRRAPALWPGFLSPPQSDICAARRLTPAAPAGSQRRPSTESVTPCSPPQLYQLKYKKNWDCLLPASKRADVPTHTVVGPNEEKVELPRYLPTTEDR